MSSFDFIFTLFGLLLGLAVAEVLQGFSRVFKARHAARIGWLTPLLGLFVILDLTSFWISAWVERDLFVVRFWVLLVVLMHTGLYYLAATLIFPDDPKAAGDHNDHYFSVKRWVIGAVILANLPNYIIDVTRTGLLADGLFLRFIATSFFVLAAWAWWTKGRRESLIALALLVALYPVGAIYSGVMVSAAEITKRSTPR
jgi:hypothetical protein